MMLQMDGMGVLTRTRGHANLKHMPMIFQTARAEKKDINRRIAGWC